jgi:hypothetical protein
MSYIQIEREVIQLKPSDRKVSTESKRTVVRLWVKSKPDWFNECMRYHICPRCAGELTAAEWDKRYMGGVNVFKFSCKSKECGFSVVYSPY